MMMMMMMMIKMFIKRCPTEALFLRNQTADPVGTLVTSTDSPTQDAARRINLATIAYSKVSGHCLSYKQLDLRIKLQATAALVDATLLHGCKLWPPC